jgi:hypothetical protein
MVSGSQASMPLLFLKDVPKQSSKLSLDFSSLLGPVFYMWIINLLFPVRKSSSRICVKLSNLFSILCVLHFNFKSNLLHTYFRFFFMTWNYVFLFVGDLNGIGIWKRTAFEDDDENAWTRWSYWAISYFYFLAICCIYMLAFIIFGSIIGKVFFSFAIFEYQIWEVPISLNHTSICE